MVRIISPTFLAPITAMWSLTRKMHIYTKGGNRLEAAGNRSSARPDIAYDRSSVAARDYPRIGDRTGRFSYQPSRAVVIGTSVVFSFER